MFPEVTVTLQQIFVYVSVMANKKGKMVRPRFVYTAIDISVYDCCINLTNSEDNITPLSMVVVNQDSLNVTLNNMAYINREFLKCLFVQ